MAHRHKAQILNECRSRAFAIVVRVVINAGLQVSRAMNNLQEKEEECLLSRFNSIIGSANDIGSIDSTIKAINGGSKIVNTLYANSDLSQFPIKNIKTSSEKRCESENNYT